MGLYRIKERENALGATWTPSDTVTIRLGQHENVNLQVKVDNGAGGAPSDAPIGSFRFFHSNDGISFVQYGSDDANIMGQLAKLSPRGSALHVASAQFLMMYGAYLKILYVRESGGGGDSRITLSAYLR